MMKYFVNDGSIIGCGLCKGTCPEVFSMTDEGVAKAIETEGSAECKAAAKVKNGCPAVPLRKLKEDTAI